MAHFLLWTVRRAQGSARGAESGAGAHGLHPGRQRAGCSEEICGVGFVEGGDHRMAHAYVLGARFASVGTQLWNAPAHATYAKLGFRPHCVLVGRTRDEGRQG